MPPPPTHPENFSKQNNIDISLCMNSLVMWYTPLKYKTIANHIKPYQTLPNLTKPYQTKPYQRGKRKYEEVVEEGRGRKVLKSKSPKAPGSKGPWVQRSHGPRVWRTKMINHFPLMHFSGLQRKLMYLCKLISQNSYLQKSKSKFCSYIELTWGYHDNLCPRGYPYWI